MSEPGAAEADCASLFMLISLQLGGLPLVKRPAQLDQAPARGERVKRLPSRRGEGTGQSAGGAEDKMSLACIRRRPNLGHVSPRPPDRSGLGLRRARAGEHEQHEGPAT
jgi:hypothetical protein